jgi:hypothetical protein
MQPARDIETTQTAQSLITLSVKSLTGIVGLRGAGSSRAARPDEARPRARADGRDKKHAPSMGDRPFPLQIRAGLSLRQPLRKLWMKGSRRGVR